MVVADEPDWDHREPLELDFGPADSARLELAYALAGGAKPAGWWSKSHGRILTAARSRTWPARLVDVETLACEIVGDEFYDVLQSPLTGLHPAQWLRALVQHTGAALRADLAHDSGQWRQLWALLCGVALMVPPGDEKLGRVAREFFPDIEDPYETAQAEVEAAAQLLADRGLAAGFEHPDDGWSPAGDPLVARDAYGSRLLLVAPFSHGQGQDGDTPDHWYAWVIDACWVNSVERAGVFGSAEEALLDWQAATGTVTDGATLSPIAPALTAKLLAPSLVTGPLADILRGDETREYIREHYRHRRRAHELTGSPGPATGRASAASFDAVPEFKAFLRWYAARGHDVSGEVKDDAGTILEHWGPPEHLDARMFYACSPHRIEMTAHMLREQYDAEYANAALRLLPQWTEWCIEKSGVTGELAARARGAALTEAAALVEEDEEEDDDDWE